MKTSTLEDLQARLDRLEAQNFELRAENEKLKAGNSRRPGEPRHPYEPFRVSDKKDGTATIYLQNADLFDGRVIHLLGVAPDQVKLAHKIAKNLSTKSLELLAFLQKAATEASE